MKPASQKKKVRTYSANDQEAEMLTALSLYHGQSKSGVLTGLVKKEFWRVFPNGTENIKVDPNAAVSPAQAAPIPPTAQQLMTVS